MQTWHDAGKLVEMNAEIPEHYWNYFGEYSVSENEYKVTNIEAAYIEQYTSRRRRIMNND